MGFLGEIRIILDLLPKSRQNLLFSLTLPSEIRTITRDLFQNSVVIEVNLRNSAAKSVKRLAYEVDTRRKPAVLFHLLHRNNWDRVLVFTRTLAEFRANTIRMLIATDIAARGLDFSGLSHVVNFDLPRCRRL